MAILSRTTIGRKGSSRLLIEVPVEALAEPSKEGMEIVSPNSLSLERTQTAGSEGIPHPKTSEKLVKELTLSDKVLEQIVAQVGGTVVDAPDSALPSFLIEEVRPAEETKTSQEESKELVVSFPDFMQDSVEWDSATELARERAANLATKCAAMKVILQEREAQLQEKKIKCKVLQLNLKKEFGRCAELEETCGGIRKSNENGQKMTVDLLARLEKSKEAYDEAVKQSERLITTAEKREKKHIEELALLEAQRAEEVRIAEKLRGKIAEAKTTEEDLRRKVLEIKGKYEAEFRRAEELSASLTERVRKHEEELVNCAKKLTGCELARTSTVECKLKIESECRRLREQLDKADMRSQKSHRRMEKVEEYYRHLRDETTDGLKLRLEKCLNGFAMWGLQTVKWLKFTSLERRLMSAKTNGSVGHKQIVELVNTFS
ncbi:hypothetical protein AXG93_1467s1090 [Marchantia polymorpha subsp. ruderalis]|uniref:Uncharacterized protein n=1 Tax=Marchantia polymorpha subsp. ruderalis TaxID=1480154 RepID=A0A176WK26_MARPO|nr:hypothetical protein AXG93_1467s1090 [Marchantia polymorpha subsp. ruderalis]